MGISGQRVDSPFVAPMSREYPVPPVPLKSSGALFKVAAFSAGSRPSGIVNPKAVAAMAELGYDLTTHRSRSLDEVAARPPERFDVVVTMGCGDACPWVPAARREDWALPDPKAMDLDGFRAVRDEIGARVQALLASLA
jgi:arsenate reductase